MNHTWRQLMNRPYVVSFVIILWLVALVPVVQQLRETLLFQRFNTEWEQRHDFDLSLQFAGRQVEIRETGLDGEHALVSVLFDGRIALPPERVTIAKDTGNLTRYHRSLSQSRFVSRERNDSSMLVGRYVQRDGEPQYDVLIIDRNGGLEVKQDITAPTVGDFLQFRVFSQLGRESLAALPYIHWSILQRLGGSFSGAFILGVLAPWIVLAVTSILLMTVLIRTRRHKSAKRGLGVGVADE